MDIRYGSRSLMASLMAGVAVIASPALAQNAPATPVAPNGSATPEAAQTAAPDSDVVVTGSRIADPNITAISPVQVVGAQEFKLQGTTHVEEVLKNLPQISTLQGQTTNNGSNGTATLQLRNLGAERTLVLINGRRLGPGDAQNPVPDVNFIPTQLLERVEVLTGGASAVYGSDAVAGVVNFIINKRFEGVMVDAQYSFYQHDEHGNPLVTSALAGGIAAAQARGLDPNTLGFGFPKGNEVGGAQKNLSVTIGTSSSDGRGHFSVYGTYRQNNQITQGERDFSDCGLSLASNTSFYCPGSSTTSPARFRDLRNIGTTRPIYAPTGSSVGLDPANPGALRLFVNGTTASDGYNFNPVNLLLRPDERYTGGAFADYEVSPAFDPYLEVMFMDDHSNSVGAPGGAFYGGVNLFVNCNSPLLRDVPSPNLGGQTERQFFCGANAGTANAAALYIGKRNIEGTPRISDQRHTDFRIVAGAKGDIGTAWHYDAYGQVGRTLVQFAYINDVSARKLQNSLLTTTVNGQIVCQSAVPNAAGIVTDAACVPYNIFTPNSVTAAAVNYIQTTGLQRGVTTEYVAAASITGDLGKYGIQSPWAAHGIGVSFGADYSQDRLDFQNDASYLTGDLLGAGLPFGQPNTSGTVDVKELFAELSLPIASDKPFIDSLTGSASYRHSEYNLSGKTNTYRIGLEFAPVSSIRFRGGYNRAARAPNTYDLFKPAYIVLSGSTDPCSGATPTYTLAQCRNSFFTTVNGVRTQTTPDSAYGNIDPNPANQYNSQTRGNANLVPEIADTYTVGFVFTPTFLRNFSFSADAYDIRIKQTISTLGADFTENSCVSTGNPFFCNLINRAPGSGSLWYGNGYTDNPTLNLGKERTRGIDIASAYRTDIGRFGSLAFNFSGTYVDKFEVEPISGSNSVGSYDCAGLYGVTCGTPTPNWRHQLRVTYALPKSTGIQISGNWRYTSPVDIDYLSTNPLIHSDGYVGVVDAHIGSYSYFDLTVVIPVQKLSFRAGVSNLFDKDPPLIGSAQYGSAGNANTYPGVYDATGRYIYAGFSLNF